MPYKVSNTVKKYILKCHLLLKGLAQKSPKSLSHINMKLSQYKEGVINFLLLSRFILLSALAFQTSRQPSSFSKGSFRCVLYFFGMQNWHTFLPLPNSHKDTKHLHVLGLRIRNLQKLNSFFVNTLYGKNTAKIGFCFFFFCCSKTKIYTAMVMVLRVI